MAKNKKNKGCIDCYPDVEVKPINDCDDPKCQEDFECESATSAKCVFYQGDQIVVCGTTIAEEGDTLEDIIGKLEGLPCDGGDGECSCPDCDLELFFVQNEPLILGEGNSEFKVTVLGGSGNYSYKWKVSNPFSDFAITVTDDDQNIATVTASGDIGADDYRMIGVNIYVKDEETGCEKHMFELFLVNESEGIGHQV